MEGAAIRSKPAAGPPTARARAGSVRGGIGRAGIVTKRYAAGTKAAERRAGHCAEALEVLAALDAELADAARQSGQLLGWTAAESAVRELIARTIDHTTDLQQLYQEATPRRGSSSARSCGCWRRRRRAC